MPPVSVSKQVSERNACHLLASVTFLVLSSFGVRSWKRRLIIDSDQVTIADVAGADEERAGRLRVKGRSVDADTVRKRVVGMSRYDSSINASSSPRFSLCKECAELRYRFLTRRQDKPP